MVHTGTADGGHYYAFIRDRYGMNKDKWYSFNDAEVKPFDPNQIASECFGGEMNSRTYDQVTDKFMDLSIEKTNSAYMLFYERIEKPENNAEQEAEPGTSEMKTGCVSPMKSLSSVSGLNQSGSSSLSPGSIGTIHILRKHLYSTKLNLTTFQKPCFRQNNFISI